MNVKKTEPIWPKFCVGRHMTLGKVKLAPNKIRFPLNFENLRYFF